MADIAFAVIGNVLGATIALSHMPTMVRMYKTKTIGTVSFTPYISMWLGSVVWTFYGYLKRNYAVFVINIFTSFCAGFYVVSWFAFAEAQIPRLAVAVALCGIAHLIIVGVTWWCLVFARYLHRDPEFDVGVAAVAASLLLFSSPVFATINMLRTRDTSGFPFLFMILVLVSCVITSAYGFVIADVFILLPNALGVLLAAIQLGSYLLVVDKSQMMSSSGIKQWLASFVSSPTAAPEKEQQQQQQQLHELQQLHQVPVKDLKGIGDMATIKAGDMTTIKVGDTATNFNKGKHELDEEESSSEKEDDIEKAYKQAKG